MHNKRNISTLEYFNMLQIEYLLYELRSKIYPYLKDREKFKNIMEYKKSKINDISVKNRLLNIFDNPSKRIEFEESLFKQFCSNEIGTPKDRYFYYLIGSDFSYKGKPCKIQRYCIDLKRAVINFEGKDETVSFSDIKKIL